MAKVAYQVRAKNEMETQKREKKTLSIVVIAIALFSIMAMTSSAILFTALYWLYVVMIVVQLAVIVVIDFNRQDVSWWTLLYPGGVTAMVVVFNAEFQWLIGLVDNYYARFDMWLLFALLIIATYAAYAFYPKARRMPFSMFGEWRLNSRWCNPDNGPPRHQ